MYSQPPPGNCVEYSSVSLLLNMIFPNFDVGFITSLLLLDIAYILSIDIVVYAWPICGPNY